MHTKPLGWKLFTKELDALTHCANGGIAILRIDQGTHATLLAENMVSFRGACRSLNIAPKHIERCTTPSIILVGSPFVRALNKCEK